MISPSIYLHIVQGQMSYIYLAAVLGLAFKLSYTQLVVT